MNAMKLTSAAFENGGMIPSKYTCEGDRLLSPPVSIAEVPEGSKSLALIMEDPDVPRALREDQLFIHWVLFNIPPDTSELSEGARVGMPGVNTRGETGYTGPCPPSEYEPQEHRYIFTLYALDTDLPLAEGATKEDVLAAMQTHVVETALLLGRYKKLS